MPKPLLWLGLIAATLLAGYWCVLFLIQRSLIFPAPLLGATVRPPALSEQVWLRGEHGRSEAWFLPPPTTLAVAAPLIVYAHGNGELIDFWPPAFDEPRRRGLAVLLVEYPGYGRSTGRPSQATVTTAMLAAYDWARTRPDIDSTRIIAYGRSLGGGAACQLAARRPVAALVLESAFTSLRPFARSLWAPAFLVRDPFDNLAVVRAYHGPVLLLHGRNDEIVAPSHALALAAAAPQAELHWLDCGHNDCPQSSPLLLPFLRQHDLLPAASATGDARRAAKQTASALGAHRERGC